MKLALEIFLVFVSVLVVWNVLNADWDEEYEDDWG